MLLIVPGPNTERGAVPPYVLQKVAAPTVGTRQFLHEVGSDAGGLFT